MPSLVLTLAGPLQAWGSDSRFTRRGTERAPTKSGVLGLLASAQGRRRVDPLEDLLGLRFGVRIDQPGRVLRDFQTARRGKEVMPLSNRFYLADAIFLAVLEGDRPLVEALAGAVRAPHFLPFLGRRSCPPSRPVYTAVRDEHLDDVLANEAWQASTWWRARQAGPTVTLETLRDAPPGSAPGDRVRDAPVSFDPNRRLFDLRQVLRGHEVVPTGSNAEAAQQLDEHDPMALLGGA